MVRTRAQRAMANTPVASEAGAASQDDPDSPIPDAEEAGLLAGLQHPAAGGTPPAQPAPPPQGPGVVQGAPALGLDPAVLAAITAAATAAVAGAFGQRTQHQTRSSLPRGLVERLPKLTAIRATRARLTHSSLAFATHSKHSP
jgi:hypothetical protein